MSLDFQRGRESSNLRLFPIEENLLHIILLLDELPLNKTVGIDVIGCLEPFGSAILSSAPAVLSENK